MLDRETLSLAEALAVRLIRLADLLHKAGDLEGEAVARSVVDGICDAIDLAWVRERHAHA